MFGLAVLGGGLFPCPDSREEWGGMLLDLSFDSCVLSSASSVLMGSFVTPYRSGGFLCCVLCSSTTGRVYFFSSMEGAGTVNAAAYQASRAFAGSLFDPR